MVPAMGFVVNALIWIEDGNISILPFPTCSLSIHTQRLSFNPMTLLSTFCLALIQTKELDLSLYSFLIKTQSS
jgi:hypothetical protein